jgi:hypothetical protein
VTLDVPRLIADINRRLETRQERGPIVAYWYQIPGSRRAFALQIQQAATDKRIIPLVVNHGFQNVNELMSDLGQLICDHENAFDGVPAPTDDRALVLLLLSHDEFRIAQVSSPTVLPDWFPGLGSQEVSVWIEDLTWTAEVPVNAIEIHAEELHKTLYDLDLALTRQLRRILVQDHNRCAGWFAEVKQQLKKPSEQKFEHHLTIAEEELAKIPNSRKYRLDLKRTLTPLACGVRLSSQTTPDKLGGLGQLLTRALGLQPPLPAVRDNFIATLASSTNEETDPEKLFGRNLLLTAYVAHRFLTVSAHADRYPAYPLPLLRSVSLELRTIATRFNEVLALLD